VHINAGSTAAAVSVFAAIERDGWEGWFRSVCLRVVEAKNEAKEILVRMFPSLKKDEFPHHRIKPTIGDGTPTQSSTEMAHPLALPPIAPFVGEEQTHQNQETTAMDTALTSSTSIAANAPMTEAEPSSSAQTTAGTQPTTALPPGEQNPQAVGCDVERGAGRTVFDLVKNPNNAPFNVTNAILGTSLMWFGWFGFNGGSALGMNERAVSACLSTHFAGCFGGLTLLFWQWIFNAWMRRLERRDMDHVSIVTFCDGAIAGLVAITPASGYVRPSFSSLMTPPPPTNPFPFHS